MLRFHCSVNVSRIPKCPRYELDGIDPCGGGRRGPERHGEWCGREPVYPSGTTSQSAKVVRAIS